MSTTDLPIPVAEQHRPIKVSQILDLVRDANANDTAVYPIGGGTSLDYGRPPRRSGIGLDLTAMAEVIDYPADDMTITVQAGIRMNELARICAENRQEIPLDVPHVTEATLGGVLATDWAGHRRFAYGKGRDMVIGIEAVDGKARHFKSGGCVVKNVAGYDLAKLLIGSLGSIGIITQVTLKLRPLAASRVTLSCQANEPDKLEQLLAQLVHSETYPTAITLLAGSHWNDSLIQKIDSHSSDNYTLLVMFEGSNEETQWSREQLLREWESQSAASAIVLSDELAETTWHAVEQFPAEPPAEATLKLTTTPSGLTTILARARELSSSASIMAHAGNGIAYLSLGQIPDMGLSRMVQTDLLPLCTRYSGNVTVLQNKSGQEMTRQLVWGTHAVPLELQRRIKDQFDPSNLLNPDRYIF